MLPGAADRGSRDDGRRTRVAGGARRRCARDCHWLLNDRKCGVATYDEPLPPRAGAAALVSGAEPIQLLADGALSPEADPTKLQAEAALSLEAESIQSQADAALALEAEAEQIQLQPDAAIALEAESIQLPADAAIPLRPEIPLGPEPIQSQADAALALETEQIQSQADAARADDVTAEPSPLQTDQALAIQADPLPSQADATLTPEAAAERIPSPACEESTSIDFMGVDGWMAQPSTQIVGDGTALDLEPVALEEGVPMAEQPQLLLYSSVYLVNGKRPILAVYDACNDPVELSSRKVKRCAWIRNAPPSLIDAEWTPNKAVCALRDVLRPGAVQGCSGVNARMALCTNEAPDQSPARLKDAIASGALASLILEGAPH